MSEVVEGDGAPLAVAARHPPPQRRRDGAGGGGEGGHGLRPVLGAGLRPGVGHEVDRHERCRRGAVPGALGAVPGLVHGVLPLLLPGAAGRARAAAGLPRVERVERAGHPPLPGGVPLPGPRGGVEHHVHEAELEGLRRLGVPAPQGVEHDDAQRRGRADQVREQVHAAPAGEEAEPALRQSERAGARVGRTVVRVQGELEPAAQGLTREQGEGGHARVGQDAEGLVAEPHVPVGDAAELGVADLLEVGPRAEGPGVAGDHDGLDRRLVDRAQDVPELLQGRGAPDDQPARRGGVQPHQGDGRGASGQDQLLDVHRDGGGEGRGGRGGCHGRTPDEWCDRHHSD